MIPNKRRERSLEAAGFYHGVQLVPPEPTEAEICAHFNQEMHQVRHDTVDAIKRSEARTLVVEQRQLAAKSHWGRLEAETRGIPPAVVMPLVAGVAAVLAVGGETLLLAPVMDGFGIAEATWQYVTAATLVIVASGLVHMALQRILPTEDQRIAVAAPPSLRITTALLSAFALITIAVLGWWRGMEMIFAAEARGGEWARFIEQTGSLTTVCVTLLTLGLPLFAAAASDWSLDRLRYAWEWRLSRRRHESLKEQFEAAHKAMLALIEKRDRQIEMLEERKQTWMHTYREHYQLGRRTGACQSALWRVLLHIGAVGLLIAGACLALANLLGPLTQVGFALFVAVTLGLTGLYAHFALEAWEHPTPSQLYRRRAVIWRSPLLFHTGDSRPAVVPTRANHGVPTADHFTMHHANEGRAS
jgi:hypothetical protein